MPHHLCPPHAAAPTGHHNGGDPMKRQALIRPLATVALIAAGAALDHGLTPPTSPSSAAAAGTTPAATTQATTAAAADSLTEHAFAVASPSVVYVDSVGLGSGSGVIYDSSGDVVTNAHVVSGAQKL